MEKTLVEKLLSRVENYSYPENPRAKKKVKAKPRFVFISTQYQKVKNPDTGVETIVQIGFTYRKTK
ncbi:MAG TPA: hypothetical protein VFM18_21850 [Methanosarcina sp.]|nr:hypothetical protein [Methanosarcina sp.]